VTAKFDGTPDPTKGCFEKLENKNPNDCPTFNDTGTAETAIDSCVQSIVQTIDPTAPPIVQTKGGVGKTKSVSKYLKALLKCRALSDPHGKLNVRNAGGWHNKAGDKYTGALDPTKGCFAKLESKVPNDCQVASGDSPTLQTLAENCDDDLNALLTTP